MWMAFVSRCVGRAALDNILHYIVRPHKLTCNLQKHIRFCCVGNAVHAFLEWL
jgi:hypothetical protein